MDVIITPKAQKSFNLLPTSEQNKIARKISTLKNDPFIGKQLSGELEGKRSIKVWPYRVIYEIDKVRSLIFITEVIHRQGAYKH